MNQARANATRSRLIDSIANTRNYLTHYSDSLKEKAATGKDLIGLCNNAEVLFQLHLLQVAGFTSEKIQSMFESSGQLQQKLRGFR